MHTYLDPHTLSAADRMTGVVRRLRALAWMGHDPAVVAHKYHANVLLTQHMCNAPAHDPRKRKYERDNVFPVDLWYAVATAYDDLSMTFGPSDYYRARAREKSWIPPLGWDDDALDSRRRTSNMRGRPAPGVAPEKIAGHDHAVVRRRINGDHEVPMRPADRRECVRVLHGRGLNDWQIADALGMWAKQVSRDRVELGLESNYDPSAGGTMKATHVPGLFSRARMSEYHRARNRISSKRRRRAADLDPAA